MTGLKSRVIHGLRWGAASRFAAQGILWATTLFVVRVLAPSDYGLVSMSTVIASFIMMMGEMGLTTALVQRPALDQKTLGAIFGVLLLSGLICFLASLAAAPLLAIYFHEPAVRLIASIVSLQFLIMPFSVIPYAQLTKRMQFRELAIAEIAGAATGSGVTITMAIAGFGAYALVSGLTVGILAKTMTINLAYTTRTSPTLRWQLIKPFMSFSGFILAERSIWYWYSQADFLIIGTFLGAGSLGIYAIAKQIVFTPYERFTDITIAVALPAFASIQDDVDRIRAAFISATRISAAVMVPLFWGLAYVANDLVITLLGKKWQETAFVIQMLSIAVPLRSLGGLASPTLLAIGRPDVSFKCVIYAAAVVCPALLAGSRWGLSGVAIAWAASYPVAFLIACELLRRHIRLQFRNVFRAILPPFACATGMIAILLAVRPLTSAVMASPTRLILEVLIGAGAYVALLRIIAPAYFYELRELALRMTRRNAT